MEKVLNIAQKYADQSEIYQLSKNDISVSMTNGEIKEMSSSYTTESGLRLFKDSFLGRSYTTAITDPETLVKGALNSLEGKVEGNFELPEKDTSEVNHSNEELAGLTANELTFKTKEIDNYLAENCKAERNVSNVVTSFSKELLNSKGLSAKLNGDLYGEYINLNFPGTAAGIFRMKVDKKLVSFTKEELDEIIKLYNISLTEASFKTDNVDVLFMPGTYYFLHNRLHQAITGLNIYNKTSPLLDKMDTKIMSEKVSLYYDDTVANNIVGSEVDDEGVRTKRFPIIEKGILKSYLLNLKYAAKLGMKSSGAAYRPTADNPVAGLNSLHYDLGNRQINEMISSMKKGIVIGSTMGGHSGNVLNGDYSVGISTGWYVENGEIKGRVKDLMLAGNYYETFSRVKEISQEQYCMGAKKCPAIMFDSLKVVSK